jgi:predicted ATPase/transcriptional regulator with XRE-family HTH domain
MKAGPPGSFGAQLKALREAAGYTQEELATIAGLSVHGVSALERGERRRPHVETVRALSAALDLTNAASDALMGSARIPAGEAADCTDGGAALPLPLTTLLGRDADLQTLRQWLGDPGVRLVTLTGPGGAGKTRLALEVAREVAAEGHARVVFISLAPIRDAALVAPAIAEALGLPDATAVDFPARARVACGDRSTWLVLDNFEQVLEAAALVADLLSSVPSLRVLVTSRAALRVRGEREYVIGPLSLEVGSEALPPADLARCAAVRLFIERVRDVQPDFRLTAANGPAVAALCRRLDGLPLALELAAPWMKVLTAEDLLARLERNVVLPAAGPRDLPARQQTMNVTVAWSYQLLSPDEQRAFRQFGALPGLFPIDAAAAVLAGREAVSDGNDDALRAVAALIDKSLLQRGEPSVVAACPLYRMLETVRAYAALELTAAGEYDDALEGLARYAMAEASLAAEGLLGPAQVEWLDRVREDLESYRATLAWLVTRGRASDASTIASSLLFFWVIRGHSAEGLRWYERILSLPSLSPAAESRALAGAATMLYAQGNPAPARVRLLRALDLVDGAEDGALRAEIENMLGHVELATGNLDAARQRFATAVGCFRTLGIAWGTGHVMSASAWVALSAGDIALAHRLLDEAAVPLRRAGPWFSMLALYVRAVLAVRRGSLDEAIDLARQSLVRVRELHDKFAFVYALVPLVSAAVLKGDDVWAARLLGARDAVTERTGSLVVDKSVHDLTQQASRDVRARLGPDRWAIAYAAGRASSIDDLLGDIARATGRTPAAAP